MTSTNIFLKASIVVLGLASATASVAPLIRNDVVETLSIINPVPIESPDPIEPIETEELIASPEPMASPEVEAPILQFTPRMSMPELVEVPSESSESSEPEFSPEPETSFSPIPELNMMTGTTGLDRCKAAFASCRIRFEGYPSEPPVLGLDGASDEAVSPRLVWRDRSRHLGTVNSETEGLIIDGRGKWTLFSQYDTGRLQPFAQDQFKTFVIRDGPYSGVGHMVFQGNIDAARDLCVQVRINSYQTLTDDSRVLDNINDADECVIFRTRA